MTIQINTRDQRTAKALTILKDSPRWIECQTRDGRMAFGVPSQRVPNLFHIVSAEGCSCPDFARRQQPCKHIIAVVFHCAQLRAAQDSPRRTRAVA